MWPTAYNFLVLVLSSLGIKSPPTDAMDASQRPFTS